MNKFARARKNQAGYSLVEVMISMAVLIIVSQAFVVFMNNIGKQNVGFQERVWATERAETMLSELRAVVSSGGSGANLADLDAYNDDPAIFHYFLSTKDAVTHTGPANNRIWISNDQEYLTANNYASGNVLGANRPYVNAYMFVRNIQVKKVPNDPKMRKLYVRVYWAAPNPGMAATSLPKPRGASDIPICELYSMVHTSGYVDVPTQAMDVYMVCLESSPGWWVRPASLQSLMDSTVDNMMIRNPGLQVNKHWIRRMSFGRDLEYTPEINRVPYANAAAGTFDKTYVYPGRIAYADASMPELYYNIGTDPASSWFFARMNVDGAIENADSYPLADQFNHCMRLRQEQQYYNLLKTIDANTGRTTAYAEEVSYRMMLEAMNNPDDPYYAVFYNSIIINLHGELAPVPPLRNVADPAKDPVEFPNKSYRAVSHPEKLLFNTANDEAAFRVYAYSMFTYTAESETINYVTLFLPNLDTTNLKRVERLEGCSTLPYYWNIPVNGKLTDNLTYSADNFTRMDGTSGLRITLFNVTTTAHLYYGPPHP